MTDKDNMTEKDNVTDNNKGGGGLGGSLLGLGAVGAMVLCCAGPVLLSAGLLAGVGGLLRNPVILIGAGVLVLAAIAYPIARRSGVTRQPGPDDDADCCPPPRSMRQAAPSQIPGPSTTDVEVARGHRGGVDA